MTELCCRRDMCPHCLKTLPHVESLWIEKERLEFEVARLQAEVARLTEFEKGLASLKADMRRIKPKAEAADELYIAIKGLLQLRGDDDD